MQMQLWFCAEEYCVGVRAPVPALLSLVITDVGVIKEV